MRPDKGPALPDPKVEPTGRSKAAKVPAPPPARAHAPAPTPAHASSPAPVPTAGAPPRGGRLELDTRVKKSVAGLTSRLGRVELGTVEAGVALSSVAGRVSFPQAKGQGRAEVELKRLREELVA